MIKMFINKKSMRMIVNLLIVSLLIFSVNSASSKVDAKELKSAKDFTTPYCVVELNKEKSVDNTLYEVVEKEKPSYENDYDDGIRNKFADELCEMMTNYYNGVTSHAARVRELTSDEKTQIASNSLDSKHQLQSAITFEFDNEYIFPSDFSRNEALAVWINYAMSMHPELTMLSPVYSIAYSGDSMLGIVFYLTEATENIKSTYSHYKENISQMVEGLEEKNLAYDELLLLLHDKVCKLVDYDSDTDNGLNSHMAYQAFKTHKVVCQAYVYLYCNLLSLMKKLDKYKDIKFLPIASNGHIWIVVEINGKWYYIDPTWDDPDTVMSELPNGSTLNIKSLDLVLHDLLLVDESYINQYSTYVGQSVSIHSVTTYYKECYKDILSNFGSAYTKENFVPKKFAFTISNPASLLNENSVVSYNFVDGKWYMANAGLGVGDGVVHWTRGSVSLSNLSDIQNKKSISLDSYCGYPHGKQATALVDVLIYSCDNGIYIYNPKTRKTIAVDEMVSPYSIVVRGDKIVCENYANAPTYSYDIKDYIAIDDEDYKITPVSSESPTPTDMPTSTTLPTNTPMTQAPTNSAVPTNTPENTALPTNTSANTALPTNTITQAPTSTTLPTISPAITVAPTSIPTCVPTTKPTLAVPTLRPGNATNPSLFPNSGLNYQKHTTTGLFSLSKAKISSIKNIKSRKVKISLKKVKNAVGYQIYYAYNKKFKAKKKLKILKNKVTIKKLKKKKTIYVKVRAFMYFDGKIKYGSFGKVKRCKIKK